MTEENKIDVIVVGSGPAGVSAAITIARGGRKVVLVERGTFSGAKNMYGGVIYNHAAKEIFPDYKETAPIERFVTSHNYVLMSEYDSTTITYKNSKDNENSFIAIRGKWDKWCVEQAKKEGVIVVTSTVVKDLLVKNNKVIGVQTELEKYYADIVILADGVNSILAKKIGLRNNFKPTDVALGIKEVIKIDSDKINERFNLETNEGCITEIIGYPMNNMLGLGYIYTNRDSITIGLGITLNELIENKIKPYELLDKLKNHPSINPLIKDGELIEYSAHLIPEGGYSKLPKLYADGVLVIGDAAMLVNNLHWEGTNLAMISGKLAAEATIYAINENDFSQDCLKIYAKKLENSFILKDLMSYKDLMNEMHKRKASFTQYYIEKINTFFEIFTSVDSIPKQNHFRNFIKAFFTDRSFYELFKDILSVLKIIWGILK